MPQQPYVPMTEPVLYRGTRDELNTLCHEKDNEIAVLREIIERALKKADGNGMRDWPIFKEMAKALAERK